MRIQQAKRNPAVTTVFFWTGVKAKPHMLYLVAEKQQPKVPIYTRRRMTWNLSDFCTDPRVGKMQLYGADTSHGPLTHPDQRGGCICHTQWDAANTHVALGEKCKGNPETPALTPFLVVCPYRSCHGSLPCSLPGPFSLTPLTKK